MHTRILSWLGSTLILTLLVFGFQANATAQSPTATSVEEKGNPLFLPLISNQSSQPVVNKLSVNPYSREDSLNFYNQVYLTSENSNIDWDGSFNNCNEGTTSYAFQEAVQLRINYFRAMAGVPSEVVLSDEYNQKAQEAALMMSVNKSLSHHPPSNWKCYTADGDQAASNSNIALGAYGPNAINLYMHDPGYGNYFVGHRRWILYPQTQEMGTGDIPYENGYPGANALWVFDSNVFGPRPDTREVFVAWPPPGYVPYKVVYPRWSFSYPKADFKSASVSVTSNRKSVDISVQPVINGYGENTIVWELDDLIFDSPPETDTVYTVKVNNVKISGDPHNFTYDVIVFDPRTANHAISEEYQNYTMSAPLRH
ncbi:MAG: CAP domain-containing protein [Anaerolineales bacterium]|nr:CAP domain-containing protein [Anaerolineales bacterium]